MNIKKLHNVSKAIETKSIFRGARSQVLAIQILKDAKFKEHTTPVPALLLCITGKAIFENEEGRREELSSGDFVKIEPNVLHWVNGVQDAQLVLIK